MVLMDGGGGLVQRGAMHTAQDFSPAAASPQPSIKMTYRRRIRLKTSVGRVFLHWHRYVLSTGAKKTKYNINKCFLSDVISALDLHGSYFEMCTKKKRLS